MLINHQHCINLAIDSAVKQNTEKKSKQTCIYIYIYILTLSSKEIILGCIHVFSVTSYMLRSCGQRSNICVRS